MTPGSRITPLRRWPLIGHGFGPFFLLAASGAAIAVPVWRLAFSGWLGLAGPLPGRGWHAREMIFGHGGAVLTWVLFTAISNRTGRMPRRGAPLVALAGPGPPAPS